MCNGVMCDFEYNFECDFECDFEYITRNNKQDIIKPNKNI